MSNEAAGTIELIASELARIFDPLARRAEDQSTDSVLEWLGLRRPEGLATGAQLGTALGSAVSAAAGLPELVRELMNGIEEEDTGAVGAASVALLQRIALLVEAGTQLGELLQTLSASGSGLTPAQRAELSTFASQFAERLLQRLLVEYVEVRFPQAFVPLMVVGAIDVAPVEGGPASSLQGAYTRKALRFDRLGKLFTDPVGLLEEVYGWGTSGFDGRTLFRTLQTLLEGKFEIPAQLLEPPGSPAVLEAFGFAAEVNPALTPPGLDLSLRTPATLTVSDAIEADDWRVGVEASVSLATDLTLSIKPPFDLTLDPGSPTADVHLGVEVSRARSAEPFLLLGTAGGSRLEVQSPSLGFGLDVHLSGTSGTVSAVPSIEAGLQGGKLVISGEGGDGFIAKLLSGIRLESNFDVGMTWSPDSGLAFTGSAALEIAIPSHVTLGPLEIVTLYLRAGIASTEGDLAIPVELSGAFKASLGPLAASVDRMGLKATFTFPEGGGNLGPTDLTFAFKPPNGVGLSVDAGVVKGGGYLFIDTDRGEYAGALELVFAELLSLHAVGIINTKNPDGSPGFSLLILITAEFGTGLQLGFGFTLIGVGGLLGLNRTMNLQTLMEGVRSGAIESVMFPQDVVANAPKIISDLKALFPQKEGTFLIGPMAKLGWGTPTLVSISLGIIIEIPGDIAILGVLKIILPAEEAAVLVLQVNFAGAIEFSKKRLYFFAALFESRILFMTIEGEMGLLVAFGDDANFVVSVGGFHPRFTPPPLPFPSPNRIAITLINTDFARVRIEGYFAVTSNTLQFGARAELFFGLDSLNVQGSLAFDALFQFSPFSFIIEISASFSVRVFGVGAFSVRLRGSLEGPTPWRAHGTASISLLFFDISVDVDVTWGESQDTQLPPISVLPLLKAELEKAESWRALLPAGNNLLVSLRTVSGTEGEAEGLVLHPVGTLRVSQRRAPLELKLDKVGNQKPDDVNRVELRVLSGGLDRKADTLEQFAPAQFQEMSDAEKLSRPAFAPDKGGVELSATGGIWRSSRMVKRIVRYEEIIIDSNFLRFVRRFRGLGSRLFDHFLGGNSVAKSPLSKASKSKLQPFEEKVKIVSDTYAVVFQHNNQAVSTETEAFVSEASARDWIGRKAAKDPKLAVQVQVIPSYERAA